MPSRRFRYPQFRGDYARSAGESEYPGLWADMVGLWNTSFGPTGDVIRDYGPYRMHASPRSGSTVSYEPSIAGWALRVNEDNWDIDNSLTDLWDFGTENFSVMGCGVSTGGPNGTTIIGRNAPSGTSGAGGYKWAMQTLLNGSVLGFAVDNNFTQCTTATKGDGLWHSYIGVRDGDEGRMHCDGVLEATDATQFSGLDLSNANDLTFGAGNNRTTREWVGLMGCWGIWRRMLTAKEIRLLAIDPLAPLRPARRVQIGFVPAGGTVTVDMWDRGQSQPIQSFVEVVSYR